MRKINLIFGLGAISMALFFNSCTEETNNPPTISFDQASPLVLASGVTSATLTGTIVADAGLNTVEFRKIVGLSESLLLTVTSFSSGNVTTTDDINYTFNYLLENITENTTLQVTAIDKDDQEESLSIEIEVTVSNLKPEVSNVKIYCTLGDGSGESTCASVDGSTYAPKLASEAEQVVVDFVYFYSTNAGIFSPSDLPSVLDDAFTTWTVFNTTLMEVVDVDYASVTYAQVADATDGITSTSVENLEVGDVVGFITEDDKIGVFEVDEIEPGYNATDYIVINIKVEE